MQAFTKKTEEVIKELKTSEDEGLTEKEAEKRLKEYGKNELKEKKKWVKLNILINQFKSMLVIVLIIAGLISFIFAEYIDATMIFIIVILNSLLGFFQELRASKAVESLKELSAQKTKVIRDDKEKVIYAKELVPGDLIILESGDKVPADARLINALNLETDEAILTGESTPVEKNIKLLEDEQIPISERKNMVYMNTTVSAGYAKAIVTSTGMETEVGKIAELVQKTEELKTPLQERLSKLGKWLAILIVLISFAIFGAGVLRGSSIYEMFFESVSLAVSAIPEGLPAVVTITLAMGMKRLAKKKAIVKKLSAVETLGSTSVICTDKTGTLTKNEMTVKKIYLNNKTIKVTGSGYKPEGEFILDEEKIDEPLEIKELKKIIEIGVLCNTSSLEKSKNQWNVIGDPTEGALIALGRKAGIAKDILQEKTPVINLFSFDSERKKMSVLFKRNEEYYSYVKGAPEEIIKSSKKILIKGKEEELTSEKKKELEEVFKKMAKDALRILAFAYKKVPSENIDRDEAEKDLTIIGFCGMIDPPREEVKEAISDCKDAGIKVIMVTGDHRLTAVAIAKEIGLINEKKDIKDQVMEYADLNSLSDKELKEKIKEITVFARVTPEHKIRILEALRANGKIVAMTGDGVNDAPALKNADIGVAMSITGTDVSKESSSMILVDDNFATIVNAVRQGREIYANIKKFIRYLLCANAGEVLIIAFAVLMGMPLPLLPVHLLWINLVTDGLPAVSLGFDKPHEDYMKKKPRNPKQSILSGMKLFIISAGIISLFAVLIPFVMFMGEGIDKARTIAFTTIVMFELFLVFNSRSEHHSAFRINPFSNKYLIMAVAGSVILQCLVIYLPLFQLAFQTVPLNLQDWGYVLGFSALGLLVVPEIFIRGDKK